MKLANLKKYDTDLAARLQPFSWVTSTAESCHPNVWKTYRGQTSEMIIIWCAKKIWPIKEYIYHILLQSYSSPPLPSLFWFNEAEWRIYSPVNNSSQVSYNGLSSARYQTTGWISTHVLFKGLSPVTRNLCCQSARGNRSGAVRYFPEAVRPRGNTAAPDRFPRADWQHKFLVTGLNPDYNMVTVRV